MYGEKALLEMKHAIAFALLCGSPSCIRSFVLLFHRNCWREGQKWSWAVWRLLRVIYYYLLQGSISIPYMGGGDYYLLQGFNYYLLRGFDYYLLQPTGVVVDYYLLWESITTCYRGRLLSYMGGDYYLLRGFDYYLLQGSITTCYKGGGWLLPVMGVDYYLLWGRVDYYLLQWGRLLPSTGRGRLLPATEGVDRLLPTTFFLLL